MDHCGLLTACRRGSIRAVGRALDGGADVDMTRLLHIAAAEGHDALVHFLIDRGAQPGAVSRSGESALSLACRGGHADVVECLLRAGARPDRNLVFEACRHHRDELAARLARRFPSMAGERDDRGRTALQAACDTGCFALARELLLRHGADPRSPPTLLHQCVLSPSTLRAMVERGADVDARDEAGNTALALACFYDCADSVRYLLECEADVSSANNAGMTCSEIAAELYNADFEHSKNAIELIRMVALRGGRLHFEGPVSCFTPQIVQSRTRNRFCTM
jgi:ankyrin repeat protein